MPECEMNEQKITVKCAQHKTTKTIMYLYSHQFLVILHGPRKQSCWLVRGFRRELVEHIETRINYDNFSGAHVYCSISAKLYILLIYALALPAGYPVTCAIKSCLLGYLHCFTVVIYRRGAFLNSYEYNTPTTDHAFASTSVEL